MSRVAAEHLLMEGTSVVRHLADEHGVHMTFDEPPSGISSNGSTAHRWEHENRPQTHPFPVTHQMPRRSSLATLERWESDGGCKATDGCWVEPDGTCEHGAESWLLVLGMI